MASKTEIAAFILMYEDEVIAGEGSAEYACATQGDLTLTATLVTFGDPAPLTLTARFAKPAQHHIHIQRNKRS
jgi:hypothetical protein